MSQPDVRKGMPPRGLERGTFEQRFKSAFVDPMFAPLQRELQAIADAAWDAYDDSRKAPITRKAGAGFADPDYEIAIDWLTTRAAIDDAPPSSRRPRGTFAHPRRQRLVAPPAHPSRRHLPCFPPETA